MENKFTDNEIIKALECCVAKENCEEISCENCPLERIFDCKEALLLEVINLINRQKAEIERLVGDVTTYKVRWAKAEASKETAKSEARKEFAERFEKRCIDGGIYPAFVKNQLDAVKKEMEGET